MTKQLPHSPEAEEAIVACILMRPDKINMIIGKLRHEDFFSPKYKRCYKAMEKLYLNEEPIDAVTLGTLGIDIVFLAELKIATAENISHWSKIVTDRANLRRLLTISDQIRSDCTSGEKKAAEIVSGALNQISNCHSSNLEFKSESILLKEYIKDVEKRKKDKSVPVPLGVKTTFEGIDKMLVYSGLPRGHVTTLGAETSKGKSALSQAFKRGTASNGAKCVVVTLEDTAIANVRRDIAALSGIQNMQVQSGCIGDSKYPMLFKAATKISKWADNVHYVDDYPDNIVEMLAACEQWVSVHDTDLVIIDYLQLVPSGQQFSKEQQHIDYIFDHIIRFAKKHADIAVLLVTQMARFQGRPTIKKLYHSAKLEQGSHTILLIWDPEMDGWPRPKGGITKAPEVSLKAIDIAKNKDGPTGVIPLGWDGKHVRFYTPDPIDDRDYLAALKEVKDK